jgi:capsular polysaccharide biosynthesis protein
MFDKLFHLPQFRRTRSVPAAIRATPPMVYDLKAWCRLHPECSYDTIVPAETIVRPLPNTIESSDPANFSHALKIGFPEQYLARIPNARTVDWHGVVLLPDDKFLADSAYGFNSLATYRAYPDGLTRPAKKMPGNYFVLATLNWKNYGHWLNDSLTRLFPISTGIPSDLQFIIPAKLYPTYFESLERLGVSPAQCISIQPEDTWELETLYYVPPARPGAAWAPSLNWLREQIVTHTPPAKDAPRRIYISRSRARRRRIVNENEVVQLLAEYGFVPYVLEELAFHEQVQLFANAEWVVGNHGTGFSNMLFTRPGAIAVEIFEPHYIDLAIWARLISAGHQYWYMMAEPVVVPAAKMDDLDVSLPKLRQTLEEVLARNNLPRV